MSNINKWLKCFHGNGQKFFIKNTQKFFEMQNQKWKKFLLLQTKYAKIF